MNNREMLQAEYIELAKLYGYVPQFPTSFSTLIKDGEEAERDGRLSPMGRDMINSLRETSDEERKENEKVLDPGGYQDFLDRIKISGLVSDKTLNRIYCAEFPTGEFNACARRSINGYMCLINRGLRNLIFHTSMAVFSAFGEDANDIHQPIHQTMRYVLEICLNYLNNEQGPPKSNIQHSSYGMRIAGEISRSIRLFVVAHEIAHVELGHLDSAQTQTLALPAGNFEILHKSKQQEFEADALAQDILTQTAEKTAQNPDGSGGSLFIICGGVGFLTIETILESVRQMATKQSTRLSTTHPPSEDRVAALYERLKNTVSVKKAEELRVFQFPYDRIFNAFHAALNP